MDKKKYEYIGAGGFNPDYGMLEKGKILELTKDQAKSFGASVKLYKDKPEIKGEAK